MMGAFGKTLTGLAMAVALACAVTPASAIQPDEVLPDPVQERRARDISLGLRCLVCQNQSIDDSDADVAKDLRRVVRQRILAGDNDAEVRDYVVARYGEFVLLRPPVNSRTWLLWGGPALVLLLGAGLVWASRRRMTGGQPPLDDKERAELAKALRGDDTAS